MTIDKTIFGLRFGLNDDLYPTSQDLKAFLESPKSKDAPEPHGADLATYNAMLAEIQAYEQNERQIAAARDFREQVYYGVLIHTRLFNHALKSAVEQYKFHLHALRGLDFIKPTAFVRSAEDELSKLNPKKKDDAAKQARLQGLIDERKKRLETMRVRWAVLARDLIHIAIYIRNNLVKIHRLCEASISVLKDPRTRQQIERTVADDIKTDFKEQLKDALHRGPVTREYAETVKKNVDILLREIGFLLQKDLETVKGLYEDVRDHARKTVLETDVLIDKIRASNSTESRESFAQLEQVLLSLIADCRFSLKTAVMSTETSYKNILAEKRNWMLEHLLDLLQKERRSLSDRRSNKDRRKFNEPDPNRKERRNGKDRRSGKSRRQ